MFFKSIFHVYFLTHPMYSCNLLGRDTEEEILAGFKKFDPEDTGKITSEKFRYLIGNPKVYPLTERELRHVNKVCLHKLFMLFCYCFYLCTKNFSDDYTFSALQQ